MKRLTIYPILVLLLGAMALMFAHRAQTQNTPEGTAVPEVVAGGATTPVFSYQGQLLDAQGNPVTDSVPMIFRLFPTATGGTACWAENHTGANEVEVQGGRFSILLGSITPADTDCLADNAYLELQINGETLSPRQLLTDAIVSNGSQLGSTIVGQELSFETIPARGQIIGPVGGRLDLIADNTPLTSSGQWQRSSRIVLSSIDSDGFPGSMRIYLAKDTNLGTSPVLDVFRLQDDGVIQGLMSLNEYGDMSLTRSLSLNGDMNGVGNLHGTTGQQIHMPAGGDMYINWHSGTGFHFGGGAGTDRVYFSPNGDVSISGNLSIGGTCNASIEGGDEVAGTGETCTAVRIGNGSIQTGGIIESNLMTPEERAAGVIDRFAQGDLLCWSAAVMRLEKCTQANDPLVQAVADRNGLPIIAGAEPIKVIGPVKAGDYLVASSVPGYAIATKDPTFGIVIAQALEDFNGERSLILAFIRKM